MAKILLLEEWKTKAINLFGKNIKEWRFVCPQCKGVQTMQDFIDNDIKEPENVFYFSCIGRWVENRGCNWTLGGFFQIHETEVKSEEGKIVPVMEFDKEN